MTSKVLTNEYKKNISDGTVLTYGTPNEIECDIISINVRGRIKATENKRTYKEESKQLKQGTIKQVVKIFNECDWITPHHIFTCEFTEKGILFNKPFRFKYQVYVKPITKEPLDTYHDRIVNMAKVINSTIDTECRKNGFEMV